MRFHVFRCSFIVFAVFLTQGCNSLYKPIGSTLIAYSEDHALPEFLETTDVDLACQSGTSLLPLLSSFSRVGTDTKKIEISLYLLSAFCAEQQAHYFELLENLSDQAKTYRQSISYSSLKKRAYQKAAKHQLASYASTLAAFNYSAETSCPEFSRDLDEVLFLLGHLQGLEALLNGGKSAGLIIIPLNVSNDIYRAMACLDNKKWWGVPQVVEATLLIFLPELDRTKSKIVDITIEESIAHGRQQGVPLAETIALAAWEGQGSTDKVKKLIQEHFQSLSTLKVDDKWLVINNINNRHLQNRADIFLLEQGKSIPPDIASAFRPIPETTSDIEFDLDDL